ncbi:sodium channel and clathrin linker 1-like [Anopheles ziemanni]|uniref:sodium channel and clathrin linker 1-like n=1 Tax=Anopheles coustani TaxID=139045 RepID=UPI00265A092E|nr:sodium channel and clathrin linker 1-like [Anopheles coustani]XP_058169547.1 sodium channel and clathrin linker 1-like [Anopheles ziemanni]
MPDGATVGSRREKDRERCDLLKHVNELCHGIDQEIHSHRQEHERVRATLQELYERDREGSPGPAAHPFSEPDYKRVSDEVIRNQQNQIQLIIEEKDTFEKLWKSSQRTIRILELEIHEYRRQLKQPKSIHDLRQQYTAAVQLLEQNLGGVRQALGEKIDENRHLQQERAEALERSAALEKSTEAQRQETEALAKAIEDLRRSESQLRSELEGTMREKAELEELLDAANALAKQHMNREHVALAKVQEALQLADTAIEEKNCVVRRERDARDECDFLASTIGQVMEEAARKVEHELAGLRSGYEARIGEIERALELTRSALEAQSQRAARAETAARTVEDKFRALLKTNQNLDTDLRAASKMIVEMELKMEALQKTMAKEKETNRACSAREEDLQRLLANNEQLRGRWKREMLAVTGELQRKIETMHRENCQLRAENNQLKDQLLMVSGSAEADADVDVAVAGTGSAGVAETPQHS